LGSNIHGIHFKHFEHEFIGTSQVPKADEEIDKDSHIKKNMLNAIDVNKVAYT
jgi:hypothetical protein